MFDLSPFRRRHLGDSFFDEAEQSLWEGWPVQGFMGNPYGFRADIRDNGNEYVVEAELPGFDKQDIQLEISGDILTISASKDESTEKKDKNYIRKERRSGKMMRSFSLDNVKQDEVKATFKDGVLQLVLPKLEQQQTSVRRIDIN